MTQLVNSVYNIEAAIDFMRQAEVKKAMASGIPVLRQGEVFFVETKKKKFFDYPMPSSHKAQANEDGSVTLHRGERGTSILPHSCFKPVLRKTAHGMVVDQYVLGSWEDRQDRREGFLIAFVYGPGGASDEQMELQANIENNRRKELKFLDTPEGSFAGLNEKCGLPKLHPRAQ